jgi:hypothetical protein
MLKARVTVDPAAVPPLADRAAADRRLRALGEAISAYEAEFGIITPKELADQLRADQRRRGSAGRRRRPARVARV